MATIDAEVEELVASIKQLLVSFAPHIQEAGSADQAEEAILHLEENDRNFHRYDFVKRLRAKIDVTLGALIDEEIERRSISPSDITAGQETVVSQITGRVLQSKEFQGLTQNLKSGITAACDHLMRNFDHEFATEGSNKSTLGRNQRRKNDVIFSDEESSFEDSSSNPSDVMFMNTEHFQRIAEKLDKNRPIEIRHEAVAKLLQVDIQNCDLWGPITSALKDALGDTDDVLWSKSLKFVARGLSPNNSSTKDIYTTLVDFLLLQFTSVNKPDIPKLQDGLDYSKPDVIRLLKAFRVMNEYQQQIPQYWIRYPEKFVEEVVEMTFSLLSSRTNNSPSSATVATATVTPGHILALLDPRATWFIRWMHGHYSRSPLLKILEKNKAVVESAVRACIEYITTRKMLGRDGIQSNSSVTDPSGSCTYTGDQVEFAFFVHSLCVLSRLLQYEQGRNFFPIKVKDREEPVSTTKLIVFLIQLLTDASCQSMPARGPAGDFDPCRLVVDALKRLCQSEVVCQKCLCQDTVTDVLLDPIAYWIDGDGGPSSPSDASMMHVADVLSHIAANACGRRHLLLGETGNRFSKSKSAPIHVLAEFAKRALCGSLGSEAGRRDPSLAVVGNIVFVCRQLYSSCEGLQAVYGYGLHTAIADAWKVANHEADRAATPTPSTDGQDHWGSTANIVLWEDMLKDNLLNFSGTPKGVLLLQQGGAIKECVHYMFTRYARKLQVSKCEKFGYGYMMSQVAATSAGTVALIQTGFIQSLLRSAWSSLEVVDDYLPHIPRAWPVTPVDKTARKAFTGLAIVLSSYTALYEIVGGVALPTKDAYTFREMPTSIAALLDRVVMVDSPAKIHSLFSYEQSHVFGLRLLSVVTSCLDSCLLLQTQYKFQEMLLKAQKDNTLEDSSDILVDMLSVERNYLLVKTYVIGGPSERKLPPRTLDQSDSLGFPLFSSYPVPKEYIAKVSSKATSKSDSELAKFLASTKKTDLSAQWLDKCRKHFCSTLTSKHDTGKGTVREDLLERVTSVLVTMPEEAIFPLLEYTGSDASLKNVKLSPVQKLGIEMTMRYGSQLSLVTNNNETKDRLTTLMKKTMLFLKQQQRSAAGAQLRSLQAQALGHDWFLSTVFLMYHGDADRTWAFLHHFSALGASAYMWADRLHCSVHLPAPHMQSGVPVMFSSTCHYVEYILQAEVPNVYIAFKMSGYSPAQICQQWLRQCLWTYVDWPEVCHYVCTCLTLGIDYQVYVCVAALRHKQRQIMESMQEKNLLLYIKEEPLTGFRVGEHLEYMKQLQTKYRRMVLADMLNLSQP